jgi:hypothetical protein
LPSRWSCWFFFALPAGLAADDDGLPASADDLAPKGHPASPGAMILYRESIVDASNVRVDGDNDQEYLRVKISPLPLECKLGPGGPVSAAR